MECARIKEANGALELVKGPIPSAPKNGVVVKTAFAGICHSDVNFIRDEFNLGNGKSFSRRSKEGPESVIGVVPGHEACGTILAIGNDAPASGCDLQVGDKVMIYPWYGCRNCPFCHANESQSCEVKTYRCQDMGMGPNTPGGFGSHIPVPDWFLCVRVPAGIPMELACTLPCSAITAYSGLRMCWESLERAQKINGFASILLIGVGGVGLWGVGLAKALYKHLNLKVICADVSEERLGVAIQNGADAMVKLEMGESTERALEKINQACRDATNDAKVYAAVDFVGATNTSELGLSALHNMSTLSLIGLKGGELSLSLNLTIWKSISIRGFRVGNLQLLKDVAKLVEESGAKGPTMEFFEFSQINEGLDRLRQGQMKGRGIIKYN